MATVSSHLSPVQAVVLLVLSPLTDLNLIMFLQRDIAGVGRVPRND